MHTERENRLAYLQKKRFLSQMLTIYGRIPVLEALQTPHLRIHRLHLADSNKACAQLNQMLALAQSKNAEVVYHSKQALSRISRNSQQDQGVALDIITEGLTEEESFLAQLPEHFELMALDGITNPQNLGMIIRSVCASSLYGILLPEKGCAKLDALVIKASAGTLFKARIIRCQQLPQVLTRLKNEGCGVYGLDAAGQHSLHNFKAPARSVMVMGNESQGLSPDVKALCDGCLSIPMANGVESLNVSVAASLVAFRHVFNG